MHDPYKKYVARSGFRIFLAFLFSAVKVAVLTVLLCLVVVHFVVASYRVESSSMDPTVVEGDRILASPIIYGPRLPFGSRRLPGYRQPQRGDLVVIMAPYATPRGFAANLFGPLLSALGLGGRIPMRDGGTPHHLVKRIVGVPGDTLRMDRFVVYVKPDGASDFVAESELIEQKGFDVVIDPESNDWRETLPFSGNLGETVLQADQYFVLGDNRTSSSDSRSWGAVPITHIVARAFFRYWPLGSVGRLR